VNYLGFAFDFIDLGEQLGFSLVRSFLEVAEQIQLVRAFAAHDLGQRIVLGHLNETIK